MKYTDEEQREIDRLCEKLPMDIEGDLEIMQSYANDNMSSEEDRSFALGRAQELRRFRSKVMEDDYMYCQADGVLVADKDLPAKCDNYNDGLCEYAYNGKCHAYKLAKYLQERLVK